MGSEILTEASNSMFDADSHFSYAGDVKKNKIVMI